MPFCQVIKGDDKPCRNYARKGLTCCHSHRALENVEYVPPKPEPILLKVKLLPREPGKNVFAKAYYPLAMVKKWETVFGKEVAKLLVG